MPATTLTLAQWLIAENMLSRYQAKILLAGRPGPFVYGDYTVYDPGDGNTLRAVKPIELLLVPDKPGSPVTVCSAV